TDGPHLRRFSEPEPVREVSIVVHSSFIKESIINRLKETIQAVVPAHLLEKQQVVGLR
ncbi:MAG: LysR family transcriptional regulator, partial [Bacteroidetes bacterium]